MSCLRPLLLISATVAVGALEAQPTKSRVEAVTVYPDGAQITRVLPVSLALGSNKVILEELPADLEVASLRSRLGTATARVRSVQSDVVYSTGESADTMRLETQIEAARDEIATLDDRIEAAERQLALLDALAMDYARNERQSLSDGQADVSTWKQALEVIGESNIEAKQRIRSAEKERREVEKRLSALEQELADERRPFQSMRVWLVVESETHQDTVVTLSYIQWEATWTANYSAYLDSDASTLRLEFDASVEQFTNEPWNQVQLTLSTATPSMAMQAPEQGARFLDLRDAYAELVYRRESEDSLMELSGALLDEIVVTAALSSTSSQDSRYSVNYRIPKRVDVSNAADFSQSVPIGTYNWDVSLVSRTNPRQDPHAFLTARTRYEEETPLIGGSLRVFVDGVYSGSTQIGQLLPSSDAEFPLGLDRNIEVLALNQGGGKGRQGLLSARNTLLTDFLFEIRNQHPNEVEVEVIDFYPVSRDERMEVIVPQSSTKPTERNIEDRPGVIVWRKELDPGEQWQIRHQYEIHHPKDTRVVESEEILD